MKRYTDGDPFKLAYPGDAELGEHNNRAKQHDAANLIFTVNDREYPVTLINKVAALRAVEASNDSHLPTFSDFTNIAVYSTLANSDPEGDPGLKQIYKKLRDWWFATSEILTFHEKLPDGRYIADIKSFTDGKWETVAEGIKIAGEGYMEVLAAPYGYPKKTSKGRCRIQSIELKGFDDLPVIDGSGYWFVGSDPVGEERIVLCGPRWSGDRLLSASVHVGRSYSDGRVAALRIRNPTPGDYEAEIRALKQRAKKTTDDIAVAMESLSNISNSIKNL
jgi:hypothetical protein